MSSSGNYTAILDNNFSFACTSDVIVNVDDYIVDIIPTHSPNSIQNGASLTMKQAAFCQLFVNEKLVLRMELLNSHVNGVQFRTESLNDFREGKLKSYIYYSVRRGNFCGLVHNVYHKFIAQRGSEYRKLIYMGPTGAGKSYDLAAFAYCVGKCPNLIFPERNFRIIYVPSCASLFENGLGFETVEHMIRILEGLYPLDTFRDVTTWDKLFEIVRRESAFKHYHSYNGETVNIFIFDDFNYVLDHENRTVLQQHINNMIGSHFCIYGMSSRTHLEDDDFLKVRKNPTACIVPVKNLGLTPIGYLGWKSAFMSRDFPHNTLSHESRFKDSDSALNIIDSVLMKQIAEVSAGVLVAGSRLTKDYENMGQVYVNEMQIAGALVVDIASRFPDAVAMEFGQRADLDIGQIVKITKLLESVSQIILSTFFVDVASSIYKLLLCFPEFYSVDKNDILGGDMARKMKISCDTNNHDANIMKYKSIGDQYDIIYAQPVKAAMQPKQLFQPPSVSKYESLLQDYFETNPPGNYFEFKELTGVPCSMSSTDIIGNALDVFKTNMKDNLVVYLSGLSASDKHTLNCCSVIGLLEYYHFPMFQELVQSDEEIKSQAKRLIEGSSGSDQLAADLDRFRTLILALWEKQRKIAVSKADSLLVSDVVSNSIVGMLRSHKIAVIICDSFLQKLEEESEQSIGSTVRLSIHTGKYSNLCQPKGDIDNKGVLDGGNIADDDSRTLGIVRKQITSASDVIFNTPTAFLEMGQDKLITDAMVSEYTGRCPLYLHLICGDGRSVVDRITSSNSSTVRMDGVSLDRQFTDFYATLVPAHCKERYLDLLLRACLGLPNEKGGAATSIPYDRRFFVEIAIQHPGDIKFTHYIEPVCGLIRQVTVSFLHAQYKDKYPECLLDGWLDIIGKNTNPSAKRFAFEQYALKRLFENAKDIFGEKLKLVYYNGDMPSAIDMTDNVFFWPDKYYLQDVNAAVRVFVPKRKIEIPRSAAAVDRIVRRRSKSSSVIVDRKRGHDVYTEQSIDVESTTVLSDEGVTENVEANKTTAVKSMSTTRSFATKDKKRRREV